MLTLTFLGVGSAFAKRNYQSNALVEAWVKGPEAQAEPDDTLLIDFGTIGPLALHMLKQQPGFGYLDLDGTINYPAIKRVFITHQHSDHIGGLEELATMNTYRFRNPDTNEGYKPELISSIDVLINLWDHSLKGGLSAFRNRYAMLQDYFNVLALRPAERGGPDTFTLLDRYTFSAFPTDHIQVQRKYDWPSYGLLAQDKKTGETALYSGDTRFDVEGMGGLIASASIIFHEVLLEEEPTPVHAPVSELCKLDPAIRARMHLYHYGDNWDAPEFAFVDDEFAGFAVPYHRYTLFT